MGLTSSSTGTKAIDREPLSVHIPDGAKLIALAGNPNVGKSTVFNALTGLRQHTGNWSGKTVAGAEGTYAYKGTDYVLADTPGAYSLLALSAEEMAARDIICFGGADVTVIVCDATCLERNLNLVIQVLEITSRAVVAVNLMDEAARRGINVDVKKLSSILGVPVVGMTARRGRGLNELLDAISSFPDSAPRPYRVNYGEAISEAVLLLELSLRLVLHGQINERWAALRILEGEPSALRSLDEHAGFRIEEHPVVVPAVSRAKLLLREAGYTSASLRDEIVSCIYRSSESVTSACVSSSCGEYDSRQLKIDRLLTRRLTGIPVMLMLLALVFYITLRGASVPSDLLYAVLSRVGDFLSSTLTSLGAPPWLHDPIVFGIWRVLSWVTAVMLPPMAIFFPLFTILEDLGYLPRVAFNLDDGFRRAGACGKQSLTMCMGFGCNAAGVTGCRIIDSPRERLIAMITNSFVPCNGRFPILIAVITMFFVSGDCRFSGVLASLALTLFIVLGIGMTLLVSRILSHTLLKGVPSSMTLEMPSFRPPKLGEVIIRSMLDRTIFVLARAAAVAAPAGLLIWIFSNVTADGRTLLSIITGFLEPVGRLIGLDGVILTAFILGLPANETVLPIIIMAYAAGSTITGYESLDSLRMLLTDNGWTWLTALCTMLFTLMHWPCSTTVITVKKESGSIKWALSALLVPTLCGFLICFAVASLARVFGIA